MVHDFKDSLKVEQSQFERQDNFYRHLFGHEPNRLDYDKYPEAQREDIDLTITNKAGKVKTISEKYRPYDYNDILLEVFSVFPNKKGWAMDSHADILAYWFPSRLFLLDMVQIKTMFTKNSISKKVHLIDGSAERVKIEINGSEYNPLLIRARNKTYSSLSLVLSFEDLYKLGINYSLIPVE